MRSTAALILATAAASTLAGCSASRTGLANGSVHTPPKPVTVATPDQQAKLLDRIKSLAGTWESTDEKGSTHTSSVISVTSSGSAVREIMLPGTPHEMTNMYTMDGPTLVMTHYCAMGNQPHMRSTTASGDNQIAFAFDGVSNLAAANQLYMGQLTITFVDNDHIRQEWKSFKGGVPADHTATFELTRKH